MAEGCSRATGAEADGLIASHSRPYVRCWQ